jgi:hypothetical protein
MLRWLKSYVYRSLNLENDGLTSREKTLALLVIESRVILSLGGHTRCMMRDICWKLHLHITFTVRLLMPLVSASEVIIRSTAGSTRLLEPILRYINHIRTVFGPEKGQKHGYMLSLMLPLPLIPSYLQLSWTSRT